MNTLLIATGNAHKLEEIRALFPEDGTRLISFADLPETPPEVIEDADTFIGNAILKATQMAAFSGHWTLADDSGLAVDALDGAPGIFSARYAGTHGDDAGNNAKVLSELAHLADPAQRTGRFVCAVAIANPDASIVKTVEATVEGHIDFEETGDHGFGYDPMFIPEGHSESFGMLDPAIKARISHRANAVRLAADSWAQLQANG